MGMLLMTFRKMHLIQKKNNIEFQLTDLNQKLMDYQSLSTALANDSASLTDIASIPPSLFGSGINSLMMAHGAATQYANQAMGYMMSNGGSIFAQFGDKAPYMQQIAYMKAYEQGREQYKKRLMAQLNEKEKEMELKKTKLEAQLAQVEEEEKATTQRIQSGIQSQVSHYGLQA